MAGVLSEYHAGRLNSQSISPAPQAPNAYAKTKIKVAQRLVIDFVKNHLPRQL